MLNRANYGPEVLSREVWSAVSVVGGRSQVVRDRGVVLEILMVCGVEVLYHDGTALILELIIKVIRGRCFHSHTCRKDSAARRLEAALEHLLPCRHGRGRCLA